MKRHIQRNENTKNYKYQNKSNSLFHITKIVLFMRVKFWLFISSLCSTAKHYMALLQFEQFNILTYNHVETIHHQFCPRHNHYRNFSRSEKRLHPPPFTQMVELISTYNRREKKQAADQQAHTVATSCLHFINNKSDLSLCCCGCFLHVL